MNEKSVRSELLGCDIPVTEFENQVYIIQHRTISQVLADYPRIRIKTEPQLITEARCVYWCLAEDTETGAHYESIGESCPRTLTNDISKNYRATMAYHRAVDRAVIGLLKVRGLEGLKEYYSSFELEQPAENEYPEKITEFSESGFSEPPEAENTNPHGNQAAAQNGYSNNDYPNTNNGNTSEFTDDTVILIGSCRNRRYGEVKETEKFKEFLKWIANSEMDYPDAARKEQIKMFKKLAIETFS